MKTKTSFRTEHHPAYLRVLYILALVSLIVYILIIGGALLMPITLGAFFAMLLAPVATWLERRRLGRFAGAIIPVLGLLLVGGLLASLALRQISSIGGNLDGAADRINEVVGRLNYFLSWHLDLDEPVIGNFDSESLVELVKNSGGEMLSMMGGLTGSLFGVLIVPVLILFILYYRSHLFEFSVRFLKRTPRNNVGKQVEEARLVAQKYLVGMMKVVAILAVLNTSVLFLIGIEHAIFFGCFAAMLNVVPFIGPLVGSILPVLFAFLTRESLFDPVAVSLTFIIIQLMESQFLTPRIIGRDVRINALVAFTGLLGGAMIWGVVGMIITIPILSISMQLLRLDPRTEPIAYLLGSPTDDLRSGSAVNAGRESGAGNEEGGESQE